MPKARKLHKFIEGIESKQCSKCQVFHPLTNFRKQKSKWDGLHVQCRDCRKKYEQKNKERFAARSKKQREEKKIRDGFVPKNRCKPHRVVNGETQKHCNYCKNFVLLSNFNKNKRIWDGYDAICKACDKKRYAKNAAKQCAWAKARYEKRLSTKEGREKERERKRECSRKRIRSGKNAAYLRKKRKRDPLFAVHNEFANICAHGWQPKGARRECERMNM